MGKNYMPGLCCSCKKTGDIFLHKGQSAGFAASPQRASQNGALFHNKSRKMLPGLFFSAEFGEPLIRQKPDFPNSSIGAAKKFPETPECFTASSENTNQESHGKTKF
jgi:hypothetical protein